MDEHQTAPNKTQGEIRWIKPPGREFEISVMVTVAIVALFLWALYINWLITSLITILFLVFVVVAGFFILHRYFRKDPEPKKVQPNEEEVGRE